MGSITQILFSYRGADVLLMRGSLAQKPVFHPLAQTYLPNCVSCPEGRRTEFRCAMPKSLRVNRWVENIPWIKTRFALPCNPPPRNMPNHRA